MYASVVAEALDIDKEGLPDLLLDADLIEVHDLAGREYFSERASASERNKTKHIKQKKTCRCIYILMPVA